MHFSALPCISLCFPRVAITQRCTTAFPCVFLHFYRVAITNAFPCIFVELPSPRGEGVSMPCAFTFENPWETQGHAGKQRETQTHAPGGMYMLGKHREMQENTGKQRHMLQGVCTCLRNAGKSREMQTNDPGGVYMLENPWEMQGNTGKCREMQTHAPGGMYMLENPWEIQGNTDTCSRGCVHAWKSLGITGKYKETQENTGNCRNMLKGVCTCMGNTGKCREMQGNIEMCFPVFPCSNQWVCISLHFPRALHFPAFSCVSLLQSVCLHFPSCISLCFPSCVSLHFPGVPISSQSTSFKIHQKFKAFMQNNCHNVFLHCFYPHQSHYFMKQMRNTFRLSNESLQKSPKIHQNPPIFLAILTQYLHNFNLQVTFTHISPLISLKIFKNMGLT